MAQHLVVMSVDDMVREDLAYLKNKLYFGRLLQNSSRVERVRTIYPMLTHPVHTRIMTGCYPNRTSVVLAEGNIVDEVPTMARAIGLSMLEADGTPMEALLR